MSRPGRNSEWLQVASQSTSGALPPMQVYLTRADGSVYLERQIRNCIGGAVMVITAAGVGAGLAVGAKALDEIGKAISALEKILPWVLIQPPAAAAELASIIKEVMKAPEVVNLAVDALLGVVDEERPKLVTLAQVGDGSLVQKVEALRPHCHQIRAIADRYLSQWFKKSTDADAGELTVILETLGDADDRFFNELVVFARQIQDVATEAATLAMQSKKAEALALLASAAPALLAARRQANELALQLTVVQTKFRRRALGLSPE